MADEEYTLLPDTEKDKTPSGWGSAEPAELAEKFVAKRSARGAGRAVIDILFIVSSSESGWSRRTFQDYMRGTVLFQGYEGRRGIASYLVSGDQPGERALVPAGGSGLVRVRNPYNRHRSALVDLYEQRLQKTKRAVSVDAVERKLASAASDRALAAALMNDDWLGLHCLLAIGGSGLGASAVAKAVERNPDEVAVALANLVSCARLVASAGTFRCTQLGALVRSRVAALANI